MAKTPGTNNQMAMEKRENVRCDLQTTGDLGAIIRELIWKHEEGSVKARWHSVE